MTQSFIMLGGSLTRYHTPTLKGKGFSQELVKLAGPTLLRSIGHGLDACFRRVIMRRGQKSQSRVKHQRSVGRYNSPYQRGGTFFTPMNPWA